MMSFISYFSFRFGYLIVFLSLIFCTPLNSQSNIKIGNQAPAIQIDEWLANTPRNKATKNRFIVLDFWASWCEPCLDNVPHMNDLQDYFSDRNILFLHMTNEPKSTVNKTINQVNFETPVVSDNSNLTHINFGDGIKGLAYYPMVVLVDDKNIIRWYGSSDKLTVELMEDFLNKKDIHINQMSNNGPYNVAHDPETYLGRRFSLELWSDLYMNPNIQYAAYIKEYRENDLKGSPEVSTGTGAFLKDKPLLRILRTLFPNKKFELPQSTISKTYNFYFVNKNLDSDSNELLLSDIASQVGLDFQTFETNGVQFHFEVTDHSLLIPSTKAKKPYNKMDEDGILELPFNSLSELANALSIDTNYFWTCNSSSDKKYAFTIDKSSLRSIKSSLKQYGIDIIEKQGKIESYLFTESNKDKKN